MKFIFILFDTLKYNIYIIHMCAALTELCLLGKKLGQHSQVGYIGHMCDHLF